MPPAINVDGIMVGSANQMTLYTYDGDTFNQSRCMDTCAEEWSPLYANDSDTDRGDFSVFTRQDGRKQWALVGRPLYFRSGKMHTGEMGEELNHPQWVSFRVADYQD